MAQLNHNGTFFNNMDLLPGIGYSVGGELQDKSERKDRGLPAKERMPRLSADSAARMQTYLVPNSDWVTVRTVISTTPDQIAIAPGSLKREWTENGKRYFEYVVDHPSMNFYSFMSADYEVHREKWHPSTGSGQSVDVEVYYHADHAENVPRMANSIRKSLQYYSDNFGPYRHKQARIIEFPRYFSFAQAFPGTMPYSESIGFIADLRDTTDIDMVFYVVAHEMGHQWWAHQVIGADMQGSTLLSESMSQYSALMVMELFQMVGCQETIAPDGGGEPAVRALQQGERGALRPARLRGRGEPEQGLQGAGGHLRLCGAAIPHRAGHVPRTGAGGT